MKKHFFLIGYLFFCLFTFAQSAVQPGKVYLFGSSVVGYDSCLCYDARSYYIFTDSLNFLNIVRENSFCEQDFVKVTDTVNLEDETEFRDRLEQKPHTVQSRFKLEKSDGVLRTVRSHEGVLTTSDYCLLNFEAINRVGVFSDVKDASGEWSVRLAKSDTVIYFNNRQYHVYIVEERYAGVDGIFIDYIYLSKTELLPVYRESHILRALSSHSSGETTEVRKHFLYGILEFNLSGGYGFKRTWTFLE